MTAHAAILLPGDSATSLFNVPTLHCAGCIAKLEGGLARTAGISGARVNFTSKRVRIDHSPSLDTEALKDAIGRLGFPAEPFVGEADTGASAESRELVKALAVAGFASMNIMLLSVSVWSGAEGSTRQLFHFLSGLIALPTVAYAGRPFFRSAWAALRHGRTNMDVPISIGVLLACAISIYETAINGPHAYFDGAASLLFFLLAGRFLDSVMRARAQDSVAALLRQTPPGALVLDKEGNSQWRAADELAPGMRMLVAAGERLAADGVVQEGESSVDRSLVTGESMPEGVVIGSSVLAGTVNLDGPITVKVTAAADHTVIADIARMMEAASGAKGRYVRVADRAAGFYAPAVHAIAALSFLGWMLAGAGLHQSILIAVAVLIITCPCALGLAVPVSQVVAAGALMRRGILIKDGSALERLAEADMALFDKTGTLTLGRPSLVSDLNHWSQQEREAALSLARASRHPLARSLAAALEKDDAKPSAIEAILDVPGKGVEGRVAGELARLGHPRWIGMRAAGQGAALTAAFQLGSRPARLLRFSDALRPDAGEAVNRLRDQGLSPTIISGDLAAAAIEVGAELGIPAHSELLPVDKLARIEALQRSGHRVLMVGDGLNDAPALKAAHVSIAPSSASDVGQMAADLVFLGDPLAPVPIAVNAARRTMRIVKQNFAIAIGYNLIAVPLAVIGLVTPLVAALSMSGSSFIVIANALRLRNSAR